MYPVNMDRHHMRTGEWRVVRDCGKGDSTKSTLSLEMKAKSKSQNIRKRHIEIKTKSKQPQTTYRKYQVTHG